MKIHDIVKKLRKDLNIQICFGVLSHRPNFVSLFFCFPLGIYEALELRDGGSDYLRKGVSKVILIY